MAVAILLYNTVLTSILTLSIACGYYLYTRKQHHIFAVIGVMFAAYLVDNTIVYCTESISSFAEAYDKMFISTPSVKTIYFVILIASLLYAGYWIMRPSSPVGICATVAIYAVILICVPLIGNPEWMVFFYYLPTQLILIGMSIWWLVMLRRNAVRYQRPFYNTFRRILTYILCMGFLVLVEDTVVIFFFDVYSVAGLKINNRSWSENILFLGLACYFIKYTMVVLGSTEKSLLGPLAPAELSRKSPIDAFSLTHNLTEREHEILEKILEGKSQQEICEELVIAIGTVKTHIHNIYHKTEVTKRGQLMAKYQEFSESYSVETAVEVEELV